MAKKKTVTVTDIRKIVGTKSFVIGTDRTLKELKKGNTQKVFITSNCAAHVKEELLRLAKLNGVDVEELSQLNEELGIICKKHFPISVASVVKE